MVNKIREIAEFFFSNGRSSNHGYGNSRAASAGAETERLEPMEYSLENGTIVSKAASTISTTSATAQVNKAKEIYEFMFNRRL